MEGFVYVLLVIVGLVLLLACILLTWRKVPADKAAVITGAGKVKVVSGGGAIVIPVLQRIDYITLENISFEVGMRGTFTSDAVPVDTEGVVVIKVKNEEHMIRSAMEQFYCGSEAETKKHIMDTSKDVCEGRLREIIADMTAEQLFKDRKTFSERTQEVAAHQLSELGLELKSFTIKGISDQNGYFDALSKSQIAAAKRDAEIAEAEARRESLIRTSNADRAGEQARLEADALKAEALKETDIKKLEYSRETQQKKAVADAAYEIQKNITNQEVTNAEMDVQLLREQRNKQLREAAVEVEIVAEKKAIELAERKAERAEKELLERKVKPAEAQKRVMELEAEADKIRAVKEAEARADARKLEAIVEALAIKERGDAEADIIQKKGVAEAEAIRLRGLAEAEALEKKAEALAKMDESGKLQMVMEKMPEIARAIAEPMTKIGNITMIGGDGNGGATDVTRMALGALKAVTEGMKDTVGFDLREVMRANTFEGKTTRNIHINGKELTGTIKQLAGALEEGEAAEQDQVSPPSEE